MKYLGHGTSLKVSSCVGFSTYEIMAVYNVFIIIIRIVLFKQMARKNDDFVWKVRRII